MSMMIGGNTFGLGQLSFKKADGTAMGACGRAKRSTGGSSGKKTKRLQYNFKEVSSRILRAKTSVSASRAVAAARGKVALLERKRRSGEYDESELEHAILHAMKMVRIARKKLKHLKMEEMAKNSGAASNMPDTEELEEQDPFGTGGEMEQSMDEMEQSMDEMKQSMDEMRQSMDEMQRSMEEMRQSMEEFTDEMEELEREMSCDDLADELGIAASGELTPEDLDRLRKKHRSDEQREIMEADMKYLRALFERLAQEQQNGSGGFPGGIALELSGTAVPVEAAAPAAVEGASVDVAL